MTANESGSMKIADTTANPAPLGLLGFGMTTLLLNLHNIGFFPVNSMIMGMGIFVGGLAQVIAGVQEWKKNNTFGATAFTAYGFFWMSLVVTWVFPVMGLTAKSSETAMGFYLAIWGLFTLMMLIGTFRLNLALVTVFLSLTVLFGLLSAGNFTGNKDLIQIAGWIGVFCGLSAFYASVAQILNEVYGTTVFPLGALKK